MRGDCRRWTALAPCSLALGCSFLLTKHISWFFRNKREGKTPTADTGIQKGRVGGNRASKVAPVPQSLDAVGIYPRHEAVLMPRRRILVPDHAAQEEHPHP